MDAARNLMAALRDSIAQAEALADELVLIADTLPETGGTDFAGGLRAIVRHHRVRAIALRGQLCAKGDGDVGTRG